MRAQLSDFHVLTGKFVYGSYFVESNRGGVHLEHGLHKPRSTLLPAFTASKAFGFGPLTNSKAIIEEPSECEESEIEVTDIMLYGVQGS